MRYIDKEFLILLSGRVIKFEVLNLNLKTQRVY